MQTNCKTFTINFYFCYSFVHIDNLLNSISLLNYTVKLLIAIKRTSFVRTLNEILAEKSKRSN